jgi:hypothetical protein
LRITKGDDLLTSTEREEARTNGGDDADELTNKDFFWDM